MEKYAAEKDVRGTRSLEVWFCPLKNFFGHESGRQNLGRPFIGFGVLRTISTVDILGTRTPDLVSKIEGTPILRMRSFLFMLKTRHIICQSTFCISA